MSSHMRHTVHRRQQPVAHDKAADHHKPLTFRSRPDRATWWYRLGYLVVGLASLVWLGLRSGLRPSRLVYPCQQAAAAQGLGFLAYVASVLASTRVYCWLR